MASVFQVGKGGVPQGGMVSGAYTKVTWQTALKNEGGYFDTSTGLYHPPAGLVIFSWQVWIELNACVNQGGAPQYTAKLIKNGVTDIASAIGTIGSVAGTVPIPGSAIDVAVANDYYQINCFCTSPDGTPLTLDGNNAHVWWHGVAFADR